MSGAVCEQAGAYQGRIDLDKVTGGLDLGTAQIFLCGQSGFGTAMRVALLKMGVHENQINEDVFCSPQKAVPETRLASHSGPLAVRFTEADFDAVWTSKSGTLLDLADANGISFPANFRSGACRACLQPIDGSFENLMLRRQSAEPIYAVLHH